MLFIEGIYYFNYLLFNVYHYINEVNYINKLKFIVNQVWHKKFVIYTVSNVKA